MNRILISGASGFIGKNLMPYLHDSGFNVHELNLRALQYPFDFRETDAIIHLAGKAHDLKNVSSSSDYYIVNNDLTQQLYKSFLDSGVKKFIFISSVKASADYVEGVLTEDDIPEPKTHYGKSKLMAEEYIQSQPLPEGKSFYILRPCLIHGPGNKGNLNLLYQLISRGVPYPLGAFENRRSFLSVENLCFVIRELLMRDDIASGIYHVADDEALSTNELVKLIAEASGQKPRLWKVNRNLIELLSKLGDILKFPLNTERLSKLVENYVVDNSKLTKAIGCKLPVSARDGILKTIRSFQ